MAKRRAATTPAPSESKAADVDTSTPVFSNDKTYQRALPDMGLIRGWDMHFTVTLVVLAIVSVATAYGVKALESLEESGRGVGAALGVTSCTVVCLWYTVMCCTGFCFCGRRRRPLHDAKPQSAEQYAAVGLGATAGKSASDLYLDMVKRTVCNTIYQDAPQWLYDDRKQPFLANGFDLEYRSRGEDVPRAAHTMVGLRRLANVQHCVTMAVRNGVEGDLVETGVFRGGTVVFMKACLRVLGAEDRRVWACDTFVPQAQGSAAAEILLYPILRALASIPGSPYRLWLANAFQAAGKALSKETSFPEARDMSQNTADIAMFLFRYLGNYANMSGTGLGEVKETFAKYGLLDDNVKFLRGYFSDTLPGAPIDKVSVLRLDGDTYESTITALEPLYDKVSPGGFIIVDDYNSLSDCQTAIDEFRTKRGITDPLIKIDNLAVYWQKTA